MTTLLSSPVLAASNAEVLEAIRDPDISIAIWERDPITAFHDLLSATLAPIRFSSDMTDLSGLLLQALEAADYPRCDAGTALVDDITGLAVRFARIMRTDAVDIRLDQIHGDACRKFHTDYVTARLVTTYAGRGTQWVDRPADDGCDCGEPHNIRELGAGHVAILKGRNWDEERAAIHRSPPIAGTGERRLLLVINPAEPDG